MVVGRPWSFLRTGLIITGQDSSLGLKPRAAVVGVVGCRGWGGCRARSGAIGAGDLSLGLTFIRLVPCPHVEDITPPKLNLFTFDCFGDFLLVVLRLFIAPFWVSTFALRAVGVGVGFGGVGRCIAFVGAIKLVDFGLQGKDLLIPWVLFAPQLGLAKGVILGLCLDHEIFKVHILVLVIGLRLEMTNMMKKILIGAGLVGSEESSSNAIALDGASIAIDD